MTEYVFGRVGEGKDVHLFKAKAGTVEPMDYLPSCGSGGVFSLAVRKKKVSLVKSGDPNGEELTCRKCKAILYGGKPSDYR